MPPRIPQQVASRVDADGFIINPTKIVETLSQLSVGETPFENGMLIKTTTGNVYAVPDVVLGQGTFGRVELVQLLQQGSSSIYPVGTFMAMKTFVKKEDQKAAIVAFDLQKIPYDAFTLNHTRVTVRPLAYGEDLLTVLFTSKKGAKKPLTFTQQLEMAMALLDEVYLRFEQKKLVHCALKLGNIIWDQEEKKATIIDEEDVKVASLARSSQTLTHTPLYRPAEIAHAPYSLAGDRYSMGIIFAEIFLADGIARQTVRHPGILGAHIHAYLHTEFDLSSKESLIKKIIQALISRLIADNPLRRPSFCHIKQILMQLHVLNSIENAAQLAALKFMHDKYVYFSMQISALLLAHYKGSSAIPRADEIEKQITTLITTTLSNENIDAETIRDLCGHVSATCKQDEMHEVIKLINECLYSSTTTVPQQLLVHMARLLNRANAAATAFDSKIFSFVDNELRGNGYSTNIPFEVELLFINYFTAHPEEHNYQEKLDSLFRDRLMESDSLKAMGFAYYYLEERMQKSEPTKIMMNKFIAQNGEWLKQKIMTLYIAGFQGTLTAHTLVTLILNRYHEMFVNINYRSPEDRAANRGIYHLLSYENPSSFSLFKHNDKTDLLYDTIIQSSVTNTPLAKISAEQAAELLIKKYYLQ